MSTHKQLSFIKSTVRLIGYFAGFMAFWDNQTAQMAFAILFASEVVGVIEEVDEK